uniref:SFRICE_008632 n=1 Tax=Spodoptera frugiperda TaxID=7108 RepID=A0A2H1VG92_SPOFR
MEERLEWSASAMVRLLHEYRQRRELWCKAHPLYREPSTKYESWSDLAAQFECPIAEIRKKLNSIFASYRREKIKIRQGGKTHWFLYDYLKFLPNHVEPAPRPAADSGSQQASSNPESKSGESSDNNEEDDAEAEAAGEEEEEEPMEEQEQVIIKEEPSTSETYNDTAVHEQTPPSPASAPSPPSPPAQPRRRGRPRPYTRAKLAQPMKRKLPTDHDSLDDKLVETLKLLKKSELSRKKDECDSFGEYIAMSLRKHDERTQSMIKQAINNILFEQEMRLYSGGQYTVLLTGPEENPLVFEAK